MERYCLSRINVTRVIVSICSLLAIMAPPTLTYAQTTVSQSTSAVQSDVTPMARAAGLLGKPAPGFVVMTLDGKEVSLADYKGKALIVNFWATWCAACRLEMPWLVQLREQYASHGLEIVGIVTDGATEEKVRQIADRYGVKYPILRCNHKTTQAYGGLPYLPESFYIDKAGKVVLASADAGSKDEIEANIRKLLGLGAN
ncbi:MAG: TlpA disulfide reductase family protein [Edaphobacter sp.]